MKHRSEIKEELIQIAPVLAAYEKKNPFTVPAGYFESNEKRITEAIATEESNKKLKLNHPAEMNMEVPDGYFESLPNRILARVKSVEEAKVIEINRGWGIKNVLQLAAAIAALVVMMYPIIRNQTIKTIPNVDVALHQVSNEELSSYVSENVIVLSEEDIAINISEAKLDEVTRKINSENFQVDETMIDVSQIDLNDIENL